MIRLIFMRIVFFHSKLKKMDGAACGLIQYEVIVVRLHVS